MNLDRKQLGILAGAGVLIAVAGWILFAGNPGERMGTARTSQTQTATAPTPAQSGSTNRVAGVTGGSTNTVASAALRPIERDYVQRRWKDWLAGATRDPFQMRPIQPVARDGAEMSSARHLKLSATWLQTGSRLAVIDQRIYGIGDQVNGFRILRIEPGEVHLLGPATTEVINFTTYVPPPPPGQRRPLTNVIDRLLGPERENLRN